MANSKNQKFTRQNFPSENLGGFTLPNFLKRNLGGFTLVELLIVIGIIAALSTVTILTLNPAERLKEARDATRMSDLNTLRRAFAIISAQGGVIGQPIGTCYGDSGRKIYVSVPSDNSEVDPPVPPPPPSPPYPAGDWSWGRKNQSVLRNIDGGGWIPVDLLQTTTGVSPPISALPVDPINTFASGKYYSYVCGSFEFTVAMESQKYIALAQKDGGNQDERIEIGNDLALTPQLPTSTPPAAFPPTANAGSDQSVASGQNAIFNGTASDDAQVSSLDWSISPTTSCTLTPGTATGIGTANASRSVTVNCTTPATYTLTLTATDNGSPALTGTDNATLTITDATPPTIPTLSGITLNGSNQPVLNWSASTDSGSGLKDYNVQRSTVVTGPFSSIVFVNQPTTIYTDTSVSPGTTYYYKVSARDNALNESDLSGTQSIAVPPAGGPVVFDAASYASSTGVSTVTWPHTVSSTSNRILLVGLSISGTAVLGSSVTYNSVPLTNAGFATNANRVELWYLINPPLGSANIVVTLSGNGYVVGGATSWTGATQVGTFVSGTGNTGAGTSASITVPSATGEFVQDVIVAPFTWLAPAWVTPVQTQRWYAPNQVTGVSGSGSTRAGDASVVMTWAGMSNNRSWAIGAITVKP